MRDQIVNKIIIILTLLFQPEFSKDSQYSKNSILSLPLKLWICLSYHHFLQDFLQLCHSQINNSTSNHNMLNQWCCLTNSFSLNNFILCRCHSNNNILIKILLSYLNNSSYNNNLYNNLFNPSNNKQHLLFNNKISLLDKSILINRRNQGKLLI